MLYRVTIYRPCQYERVYEAAESWIASNLRTAELGAMAKLPTAYENDYSARVARHPYATVQSSYPKKFKHKRRSIPLKRGWWVRPVACHKTPIVYVPSVGDLGYSP